MEGPTLFVQDLFNESLPIDYQEQGDRWVEFLLNSITSRRSYVNGHGLGGEQASADFPYPHWNLRINVNPNESSEEFAQLKIVPVENNNSKGVYLFLTANHPIKSSDVDLWKDCVDESRSRLDEENPEFEWSAAIIQSGEDLNTRHALKARNQVGSVTLFSGGKQFTTLFRGQTPVFNGSSFSTSWPILLEGRSHGYNWMSASSEAGRDVHRIAALISLAWGTTWELIHAPQPHAPGQLKVPSKSHWGQPVMRINQPKKYATVPKWVERVFLTLDSSPILVNALNAYYQGLTMVSDNPSFALVAFVASIESVGRTIIGDKCSCCGKDNGAKQKFQAGLTAVITDTRKIKRLTEAYGARSDTAHEGVLHGTETSLGGINFPSIFNNGGATLFIHTDLRDIRLAARKTLIKAIKELPRQADS